MKRVQHAWLSCRCGCSWEMEWPGAQGERMEIRCPGCGHVCVGFAADREFRWPGGLAWPVWDEHVSPGCRFDLEAVEEEMGMRKKPDIRNLLDHLKGSMRNEMLVPIQVAQMLGISEEEARALMREWGREAPHAFHLKEYEDEFVTLTLNSPSAALVYLRRWARR